MLDVSAQVTALAERAHALRARQPRVLVALSGAPGSGKSTLAGSLLRRLRDQGARAEAVGLDGFLLDNVVLDARGMRGRKGAPETFDAQGFVHAVRRLKAGEEVACPVFDRHRDAAVAGALLVPAETEVVICEGDYLLFAEPPWGALAPLWDVAARLDVALPELRARLIQRWLDTGLSRAAATRRAEAIDVPNALRAIAGALPAELILATPPRADPANPVGGQAGPRSESVAARHR